MFKKNKYEYKPPFHCQYCGRFARFVGSWRESNSNNPDLILMWSCKHCGICKEGQY